MRSNLQLMNKLSFLSDKKQLELFPPFIAMRINVLELDDSWGHARIKLPLNWISANAAGNMFGGYQANLADPIPALACLKRFPGYRIATKSLTLDFIRVGNSDLILSFDFTEEQAQAIAQDLERRGRSSPTFEMSYTRDDGKVCTRIKNTVAIRPKGYIAPIEGSDD